MTNLCLPLRADALNLRCYFQSLTEQALCCKMLKEERYSAMQEELLLVLTEQADRFCRGESSSIPTEKTQELLMSVMFVIGVRLKSFATPEQAVESLKREPLKKLYEDGLTLVRQKTAACRHRQKRILEHLLDTPNVFYRATVENGINGFFRLYRPQFAADEIHITADYPVFLGRPELDGIEFIEEYLRRFQAENAFCSCFDPQDIDRLLCGISWDYPRIPLNIFEPVLLSALGLGLLGRSPRKLDLTKTDIGLLARKFARLSEEGLKDSLKQVLFLIDGQMTLPRLSLRYAEQCIPKLTEIIRNAIETNTLDKVFLEQKHPEAGYKMTFSDAERMTDSEYRRLTEQLLLMEDSAEKVSLIFNRIRSLSDLLELLSDAELCEREIDLLVQKLPKAEFAVLLSQFPDDAFLTQETEQMLFRSLQKRKNAF